MVLGCRSANEPLMPAANRRRRAVGNLIRSSNLINQKQVIAGSVTFRLLVIKVAFKLTTTAAKSGPRETNGELFAGFSVPSPPTWAWPRGPPLRSSPLKGL